MSKHTIEELHQFQSLPLSIKVAMTLDRIRGWIREYGEDGVYVAYSGGKDSTVLSHLVDEAWPKNKIPRVFVDTGLEYPEIREFAKKEPRVVFIKPKKNFRQVIEQYGYPFISKEVSECVYGAKKYLTKLLKESPQFDRPTDRPTDRPQYSYHYDKLCGQGKYAKPDRGGVRQKIS